MAILTHGLETIETGATAWVTILNANLTALDANRISRGLLSARPTAGAAGRFYFATDIQVLFSDTGSVWVVVGLQAKTPASASAAGTAGELAYDASFLYVCTATNTWRRIAHSSW